MQKSKLFNILNTIIISLLLLVCGMSFIFDKDEMVDKVQADYELIDGISARLGKLNRIYSGMNGGEFTYANATPTPDELNTFTSIDGKYEDPKFTMLYNVTAKASAQTSGTGAAENLYFEFGSPQQTIIDQPDVTTVSFIIDLNVTITFNNKTPIYINDTTEESEEVTPGTGGGYNKYFRQFIDLTNVYERSADGTRGNKITNASGFYTIEVNYLVKQVNRTYVNNNWTYGVTTTLPRTTMMYAFYLIDESDYIAYPEFKTETVDLGNNSGNGTIQYFYNYNKEDYPTYSYDAAKYNIEFTTVKNRSTSSFTSNFVLDEDGEKGTLTFTNVDNPSNTYSKVIDKVGNTFPVTIRFTEQGVYTITNRYVVNVNNVFVRCDNIIAKSNMYVGVEEMLDYHAQYILHLFGFTANFNNSGTQSELLMLNNGDKLNNQVLSSQMILINTDIERTIYSDITYLFTRSELYNYSLNEFPTTKLYDQLEDKLSDGFENFKVVSTDQPPISLSYFGEYYYTGARTNSVYFRYSSYNNPSEQTSYSLLRKDAYLEDAGYYEVIVNYTYSEYTVGDEVGSQVIHTQAFIFTISNTSPSVKIQNQDGTSVSENGFTNQDVLFIVNPDSTTSLNDNYFNAPINVQYTRTNFAGTNTQTYTYNQGSYLSASARYNLTVSYGLNGVSKDTYQFVIDKDPISNIRPQAVDSVTSANSDNILYYQFVQNTNLSEYYNNSRLFNQPFTLLFNEKASGAQISVTYKRFYFNLSGQNGGQVVKSSDGGSTFVTTNYELNLSNAPQTSDYYYEFDLFNNNRAHVDSVFDLDTSCLILFYLKDQAGNEQRYYVIYDLTRPYVSVNPTIENAYNIVSNDATVTWGDYKAIRFNGDLNSNIPNSEEKFTDYIDIQENLFHSIYNTGEDGLVYFTIPLNQIYLNYIDSSNIVHKIYYVKDYDPYDNSKYQLKIIDSVAGEIDYEIYGFVPSISLYTGENGETTDTSIGHFAGENNITYNISDKSNVSNDNSTIKNDNSYQSNIWLNLDKSLGLAFARVNDSTTLYGSQLNEKKPIAANQLRFSYIPGEAEYTVQEVSFDYYEVDAASYMSFTQTSTEDGKPTPYFPYRVTPTLRDVIINVDNSIRKTDDQERVFSEIINQDTVNGQTVTKTGMYVFKRTYSGEVEKDKVRYYVFYIDRTGIIDIDAELLNDERITYEQGYGFVLNFSNDGTKFTALQVQQYLSSVLSPDTTLFTSNKLPISFEMPFDKYNTRRLLTNELTAVAYKGQDYYSLVRAYNESLFRIDTQIVVEAVINNDERTKTTYSTGDFLASDIYTAECIKPGTYTISINDRSGYTYENSNGQINTNYNCNTFSFRFEITHNAPEANYHTRDLNLAVNVKENERNSVNYQEHVSTNSNILQLSFDKNTDPYKATINTRNFNVYRDNTRIFYLNDNRAYLNNILIFTITDDVPLTPEGTLETRYSNLVKENGNTFTVTQENGAITGKLNGETVYTYSQGVYRTPSGEVETEYSAVFGETLSKFEVINDVATLTVYANQDDEIGTPTTIFTLTDSVALTPRGELATEYSNIFVYNADLNRYVITLFNANDPTHTYITNALTEAHYEIELMFEGNANDFSYTYLENGREVQVDYYRKRFAIQVDRTAPSYNYNQLVNLDKFYTNKASIDKTRYFLAADRSFVFVKQNELETNEIFYRYLGEAGVISSSYLYSITPDNPYFNTGDLSNHDRFVETSTDSLGQRIYVPMTYGRIYESLGNMYGYYEIIERDEAGNYNVYAIYYNDSTPIISYTYEQAESNGIIDTAEENLTETSNPYNIQGRIVDNDNIPIANVTIRVDNTDTTYNTDGEGAFLIENLVGIRTLTFEHQDYSFIPKTKRVNELNYAYDEIMDENTLASHFINVTGYKKMRGELNDRNTNLVAEGQNLLFDFTNISNDYYLRAIINGSNGFNRVIVNEPDITNIPTIVPDEFEAWEDFISKINAALQEFSTENSYGYRFTIEFVNRFGDNYLLTYNLPGIMLTPIIRETVPNARFTFTIPTDPSGTTYIRRLEVRRFSGTANGQWDLVARDSNNLTISTYNDDRPLDVTTYTFTEGEYMFTLTDNFNRVSVHYQGVGVNDVRTIDYGTSVEIQGIRYTASNVTLNYQTALYQLSVYEINADGTRSDITNSLRANGVTEVTGTNNIRRLEFQNNEVEGQIVNNAMMDGIRQFEVNLHVQKLDLTYTYRFIINKTNPDIELRTVSGERLAETSNNAGNPTIHTEDFTINWASDSPLLFSPRVRLTIVYLDNNVQRTQVIDNIPNGYRVSQVGTYTAQIYNSLGYSDPNKTIYFRRIEGNIVMYSVVKLNPNGTETELRVSSDMPNIYIGNSNGTVEPLYKYYALKYESTVNDETITNYDTIEIRVNPSRGLTFRRVTADDQIYDDDGELLTEDDNIYRIYGSEQDDGNVSFGYNRYIQIVFIASTDDFVKANITTESHSYTDTSTTLKNSLRANIINTSDTISISFPAFNNDIGNPISLSYLFNGIYVETITSTNGEANTLVLSNAGVYTLTFFDLAGNVQTYLLNGVQSENFTISLINNVLFTVNSETPIENQIFNSTVILEITNLNLYDSRTVTVSATRDGKEISLVNSSSYNSYVFEEQGYYAITMTANVTSDISSVERTEIVTIYNFIIINQNQALRSFNIPLNPNFTITRVLRENVNITYTLQNNKELWISSGDSSTGSGQYTITVSAYIPAIKANRTFTFRVWINDEVPVITCSIDFGNSTTKQITISFNKNLIYQQIGESIIRISGMDDVIINEETSADNIRQSVTLVNNRTYTIQVMTMDGKVISSYKVIKKEPLNAVSIILIVIGSLVAVALVITFVVLRRHIKYR